MRCGSESLLIWVTVGLVFGGPRVGDGQAPLYELRDGELPDLHDGSIADWQALFAAPMYTEQDLSNKVRAPSSPPGPPDLACRIWLGWHASGRIYGAVHVIDDFPVEWFQGELPVRQEDYVDLYVDGDGGGGRVVYTVNEAINCDPWPWVEPVEDTDCTHPVIHHMRIAQVYLLFAAGPGTNSVLIAKGKLEWPVIGPWADGLPYNECQGTVVADGWLVEFAITLWDTLDYRGPQYSRQSQLTPGHRIGLDIAIVDRDDAQESGEYYSATGKTTVGVNADEFRAFILRPAEERTTAAALDTWGAAKRRLVRPGGRQWSERERP